MANETGSRQEALDRLFALVKEAFETSAGGFLKIVLLTDPRDSGIGGCVLYEHNKETSPANPSLYVAYQGEEFADLCRQHGIEPVIDVPM